MKKAMAVATAVWVVLGLTTASYGQNGVKVKVPFGFGVADRNLPQGEYLISSVRAQVLIEDAEGRRVAMVLSNPVSGRSVGESGMAVFQCYEQRCFLSEIWNPTQVAGRQLMRSHWEKEVARRKSATYFALVGEGKGSQK